MKLTHKDNGGVVVVDDEYGNRLVQSGLWKSEEAPKPRAKRSARKPKDTEES